jgi:tRNA(Arg) A34 adenosine deaminase TadA
MLMHNALSQRAAALALITLMSAATATQAHAQDQRHQHGASAVEVSLDGNMLLVAWESPLSDLTGFEHAPRTASEKSQAAQLLATLQSPSALLTPNPEAQCHVTKVTTQAPSLMHTEHAHGAHDAHSDLDYAVSYNCAQPKALAQLRVNAFQTWPTIKAIEASLVGPGGQAVQTLRSQSATIDMRGIVATR